jgi:hypothetical protein
LNVILLSRTTTVKTRSLGAVLEVASDVKVDREHLGD